VVDLPEQPCSQTTPELQVLVPQRSDQLSQCHHVNFIIWIWHIKRGILESCEPRTCGNFCFWLTCWHTKRGILESCEPRTCGNFRFWLTCWHTKRGTLESCEPRTCGNFRFWLTCWTNMRTQVKRTRIENPDAFPDAFIRLDTECDWIRLNMWIVRVAHFL
jgi:hypothetical protein